MIPAIWYVAPFGAVMALIFAFVLYKNVKSQDPGNAQMQKIAKHVREGAFAYLRQQYKGVTIFFIVAFITFNFMAHVLHVLHWLIPIAFLTGGFFSGLAGWIGMNTATLASNRTAQGASKSLNQGLKVAFRAGGVMGLVVVAIATVTYDGLSAALYEMIGHALIISPMFLIAGWAHHKTHTWYMDEMGGIMQKAPYISAIFVLAGMAALGLPGTMGFVGELTIIVSAIKAYGWWIAVIAFASLISAGYVIWAVRRAFHSEISPIVAKSNFDMSAPEFIALVVYAIAIILFGVYPQPIFDIANNAFAMFGGM